MRIFIVGLGLIGASYAEKLTEKGHHIFGYDQDPITLQKAVDSKIIDSTSNLSIIGDVDMVIIALYPKETVAFIKKYKNIFHPNQTITDVCGVKQQLLNEIHTLLPKPTSYTSHHPMAGREVSGFDAKNKDLFKGANFLMITSPVANALGFKRLEEIANDLEFGNITKITAKEHDDFIAYTSQLTHVLATALVQSGNPNAKAATGDSFKDLTRIANINATLWSELFLENTSALLKSLETFINELKLFKVFLEDQNREKIITYLNQAKKRRESYD